MSGPFERTPPGQSPRALPTCLLALALAACQGEGGSDAGRQGTYAPLARASALGLGEPAAGNRYQARAGAPVVLSAAGSDKRDGPILSFAWHGPADIQLIERSSNSVMFYAPREQRRLDFQLRVTDSQGQSAGDALVVDILPVGDADEFLQARPGSNASWLTLEAVAARDAGFSVAELIVTETATWPTRRNAVDGACGEPASLELSRTTLPIEVDGAEDAQTLRFKLPDFNSDSINRRFQGDGQADDGENIRDWRLEPECADAVERTLDFELIVLSGDVQVELMTPAAPGPWLLSAYQPLELDVQSLRTALGLESRDSALSYYAMIDPDGEAATLDGWLAQSCFGTRPAIDDAHALYINNYDLGFGRDMYICRDRDDNVYSYVVNYPGLQPALEGRGEFAVVAMEYSGHPHAADPEKIVKFYAFVPDRSNGGFISMSSMNFDGRGEKYLPGVCLACHGGSVQVRDLLDEITPDVNGTFLPFDLDAFLYTEAADTRLADPDIIRRDVSADLRREYSLENQQAAFRALNEAVLATYPAHDARYRAARELIHGWYGSGDGDLSGNALSGTFDGSFVPPGWAGQEALYLEVFARFCRACHTQQALPARQAASYDAFIAHYTDAANGRMKEYVFERGSMPLARLTMDRFWSPFDRAETPAELLRAHLQSVAAAPAPATSPVATQARFACPEAPSGEPWTLALDGSDSVLAQRYQWSLEGRPAGADAATLVQSHNERAEVRDAYVAGSYPLALTVADRDGALTEFRAHCVVADIEPALEAGETVFNLEVTAELDLKALVRSWGNGRLSDGSSTLSWDNDSLIDVGDSRVAYSFTDQGQDIADTFRLVVTDSDGDTVTSAPIHIVRNGFVPTRLNAERADQGNSVDAVDVSWEGVIRDSIEYQLFRSSAEAPDSETFVASCSGVTACAHTDRGLDSNTAYTYRLKTLVDGLELQAARQSVQVVTYPRWQDLESVEVLADGFDFSLQGNGEFNHPDCAGCHLLGQEDPANYVDALNDEYVPTQSYFRNCLQGVRRDVSEKGECVPEQGQGWWTDTSADGHDGAGRVLTVEDKNGTPLIELARRWRKTGYAE